MRVTNCNFVGYRGLQRVTGEKNLVVLDVFPKIGTVWWGIGTGATCLDALVQVVGKFRVM